MKICAKCGEQINQNDENSQINLNGNLAPPNPSENSYYYNRKILLQKFSFSKLDEWVHVSK